MENTSRFTKLLSLLVVLALSTLPKPVLSSTSTSTATYRSCDGYHTEGYRTSGTYTIDPDGDGPVAPFVAECDFSDKVPVTVLRHDKETPVVVNNSEAAGSFVLPLTYLNNVTLEAGHVTTQRFSRCWYYFRYVCTASRLTGFGWWVGYDGTERRSWGETAENMCDPTCACDENDSERRQDEGNITERVYFPISQLRFGDTGHHSEYATVTLGPLRCHTDLESMCLAPNLHSNSYHYPNREALYAGETIYYACGQNGFTQNWSSLTCRENGTWDGTYPASCILYGSTQSNTPTATDIVSTNGPAESNIVEPAMLNKTSTERRSDSAFLGESDYNDNDIQVREIGSTTHEYTSTISEHSPYEGPTNPTTTIVKQTTPPKQTSQMTNLFTHETIKTITSTIPTEKTSTHNTEGTTPLPTSSGESTLLATTNTTVTTFSNGDSTPISTERLEEVGITSTSTDIPMATTQSTSIEDSSTTHISTGDTTEIISTTSASSTSQSQTSSIQTETTSQTNSTTTPRTTIQSNYPEHASTTKKYTTESTDMSTEDTTELTTLTNTKPISTSVVYKASTIQTTETSTRDDYPSSLETTSTQSMATDESTIPSVQTQILKTSTPSTISPDTSDSMTTQPSIVTTTVRDRREMTSIIPSRENQCDEPPEVENATYSGSTQIGDVITYVCKNGYYLANGDLILKCSQQKTWEGNLPVCTAITEDLPIAFCPPPHIVGHGSCHGPNQTDYIFPGSVFTCACAENFQFDGGAPSPASMACLATGKWDKVLPECLEVLCPPLPPPDHAVSDSSSRRVGAVVTHECLPGSAFADESRRRSTTCLPGGHWSHSVGECHYSPCGAPFIPPDVEVLTLEVHHGGKVKVRCQGGLVAPSGSRYQSLVCTAQGWSGRLSPCQRGCPPVPYVKGAQVLHLDTTLGGVTVLGCVEGARFPDGTRFRSLLCTPSGVWNDTDVPACMSIPCPPLPRIVHGYLDSTSTTPGTTVTALCHHGYMMEDGVRVRQLVCQDGGQWSNDLGNCTDVLCPDLTNTPQTITNDTHRSVGVVVGVHCTGDTRFTDGTKSKTTVCLPSGQWSEKISDCSANRCPPVPVVSQAYPSSLWSHQGIVVVYTCELGYTFLSSLQAGNVTCLTDNTWSLLRGECQAIDCGPPPNISHATVHTTGTSYSDVTTVTCQYGYHISPGTRQVAVRCGETGTWESGVTDGHPVCTEIECPPLPYVEHAAPSSFRHRFGDNIKVSCLWGFTFNDRSTEKYVLCNESGQWSRRLSGCREIRCPQLTESGQVFISNRTVYRHNDILNYTCAPGYVFGDMSVFKEAQCSKTSTWSPPLLECINTGLSDSPVESPGGRSIGGVTIAVMTIVFGGLVLLDVLTTGKDIGILVRNLKGCLSR